MQVSTFYYYITHKFCLFVRIQIVIVGRCWRKGWSFFRAVSHQLGGNPKSHFHVCSAGIQYFLNHLREQFVESNTGWAFLASLFLKNVMSRSMGWCYYNLGCCQYYCPHLSIHIAESHGNIFSSYSCWTIKCYKCPKHLHWMSTVDEFCYVSTVKNRTTEVRDHSKRTKKCR